MPIVLNKKTDTIPPDAVYVGRLSKWGNPFFVRASGTREQVIEMYREHIAEMMEAHPGDVEELRGKDLVCWCAPLPCHADVLLELANS